MSDSRLPRQTTLREIGHVRQYEDEPYRRWYQCSDMDLIVWTVADARVVAFQLCYDTLHGEKALVWSEDNGFAHHGVDDGEDLPTRNMTPIMVEDGAFDKSRIASMFDESDDRLPDWIAEFVHEKLLAYPG